MLAEYQPGSSPDYTSMPDSSPDMPNSPDPTDPGGDVEPQALAA